MKMDVQEDNSKTVANKLPSFNIISNNEVSQISIREFLNFLKAAYQVQDSVEGILISGGMSEAVKWLKCKETQLSLKNICCQTSNVNIMDCSGGSGDDREKKGVLPDNSLIKKKSSTSTTEIDPLKKTLSAVLSEGFLDSVLPYLIQNPAAPKKCTIKLQDRTSNISVGASSNSSANEKMVSKKTTEAAAKQTITKTDSEVEIHVCDEVKNMKKTFICNQKLLTEKMGYFAEVTLGQKLEDMDISVHCDIGIFEWLMQWVKRNPFMEENWPELDPQCVIPILVSAAFLQMDPLLNDCLLFCHEHMNEILRTTSNLSCLNDSVLTRLAAMYTNVEVESIKDRKDKIQSRLFSKLIQSLGEPEPESVRGHWCSLARVFKCEKCEQLITPAVATKIPCVPSSMRLQPDGSIISIHIRDPTWDVNDYILKLHKTLKTWRKVYWRLWGDSHFLFCNICKCFFPSNQIGWCRYHPDTPQFFTLDAQKAPLPIGRYPCCGERAYRFQLLENYSGCQFKQHMVTTQDVRESAIFTMLEAYRHIIEEEPPQLLFPERLTRLVARDSNNEKKFICKETFWWDGFEIIPPRPKMGLLSAFSSRKTETSTSEESSEEDEEEQSSYSLSLESEEEDSAESNPTPKKLVSRKKAKKKKESKLWQNTLSARYNQDKQRTYEEIAVKQMTSILNKNSLNEGTRNIRNSARNTTPLGGVWVRLEAEWRENCSHGSQSQRPKNIFTAGKNQKARVK